MCHAANGGLRDVLQGEACCCGLLAEDEKARLGQPDGSAGAEAAGVVGSTSEEAYGKLAAMQASFASMAGEPSRENSY
jgi:hypothetical protein